MGLALSREAAMKLLWLFPFLIESFEWGFQLANWNTGRLYAFPDVPQIFPVGRVCKGTGREAISGSNGEIFANLVCQKMGFSGAEFHGDEKNYVIFMKSTYSWTSNFKTNENLECLPDFAISGAVCHGAKSIDECSKRDFSIDGGTCIEGVSDIFLHCKGNYPQSEGQWTDFEELTSISTEYFVQHRRVCTGKDINPFCSGPWLKMIPDYKCKQQDEDPDYNEDYSVSQSSYESSYYDYGQPESWSSSESASNSSPQSVNDNDYSSNAESNYDQNYESNYDKRRKRRETKPQEEFLYSFCSKCIPDN